MKRLLAKMVSGWLILILCGAGLAWAQADDEINRMLIQGYDLLEEGKLVQAQVVFGLILQKDPGNPLALNNLGAVMVKEKKYNQALTFMRAALHRVKGYQVMVNRVCDVDGLCLAFRPAQTAYGDQDLEAVIRLNIELIMAKQAADKKR